MNEIVVTSLASGSSGNSMLVQFGKIGLLIDAGLGPRTLLPAIQRRGVLPENLCGVLITHEHDDHIKGLQSLTSKFEAPVICNQMTLTALSDRIKVSNSEVMSTGENRQVGPFLVSSFPISHDAAEPVGYVIDVGGTRIFYATDVGRPSDEIRNAMSLASLCILESNHDLQWLLRGSYPPHMKARVAGDKGHLSNATAVDLIAERLNRWGPAAFWLAHLSARNNSVALARNFAETTLKTLTNADYQLSVALRDRPSLTWSPGAVSRQLALF